MMLTNIYLNYPVFFVLSMKCAELLRLLLNDGWYVVSQKGSHKKLKHSTKAGLLIFRGMEVRSLARDLKEK